MAIQFSLCNILMVAPGGLWRTQLWLALSCYCLEKLTNTSLLPLVTIHHFGINSVFALWQLYIRWCNCGKIKGICCTSDLNGAINIDLTHVHTWTHTHAYIQNATEMRHTGMRTCIHRHAQWHNEREIGSERGRASSSNLVRFSEVSSPSQKT